MISNRKSLFGKLNATCLTALDSAAGLCARRTNYAVDIEHLFLKLLDVSNSDLALIFRHFELDTSRISRDLTRAIDRMKTGESRNPALSPRIVKLVTEAWTLGSVDYNATQIRSGLLLTALLASDDL